VQIAEGTLYPLLRKLRRTACAKPISRMNRRSAPQVLSLDEAGRRAEASLRREWLEFTNSVRLLMEDTKHE
jgi:DNA-binding PadR family transcriptional regulator